MRISTRSLRRAVRRLVMSDEARMKMGLEKLHDALAGTPMHGKYWVIGGMLIGYIRDGHLIPGDLDADFAYWAADEDDLLVGLDALGRAGFKRVYRWTNNDGVATEWSLEYCGTKFDFFRMHQAEDKMRWYSYTTKPSRILLNEAPMHGLEPFDFLGRRWLKPDDHETYLTTVYGDWRIPRSDYCYWMDSQAIIRRSVWEGENQW